MKSKLAAIICIFTMLTSSSAFAYSRDSQGYGDVQAEEVEVETEIETQTETEIDEEPYRDIQETEEPPEMPGMSGTVIGGYVLITLGGLAAIAGSTIISTSDKNTLGAIVLGGGAVMSLGGTLMIMLGSRGGYAVGPVVDPKGGAYGVMVAKRF